MKVSEIMKKPEIIGPEATVKEAAEIMTRLNVGSLIVITDSRVIGILTDGDIIKRFVALDRVPSEITIKEIMTTKIIKISSQESIEYACHVMSEKNISHLPIIDGGKLVGILTSTDIMKKAPEIGIDALF